MKKSTLPLAIFHHKQAFMGIVRVTMDMRSNETLGLADLSPFSPIAVSN